MPYTNTWSSASPVGSTTLAKDIDNEIRKARKDIEERMDTIIGSSAWSSATDPVINNTTIKNLSTLTTDLGTKPTINATDNTVPKRGSATALTNSNITDTGTLITLGSDTSLTGNLTVTGTQVNINGVTYNWPASATNGLFLQYNSGSLSWVSVAAAGAIGGSGTTGELAVWTGSGTIGSATGITPSGGDLTATGTISGAQLNLGTGQITCGPLYMGTQINFNTGSGLYFSAVKSGGINRFSFSETSPGTDYTLIDIIDTTTGTGYAINGTKVVGARVTGWGDPTTSASRVTFDNTISLASLCDIVGTLIKDLRAHGLIGN